MPELEELLHRFQQTGEFEISGARRVEDFLPEQVDLGAPYFSIDVLSEDHRIRAAIITGKDKANCGFIYTDDKNNAHKESYDAPHGALVAQDGTILVCSTMFELFSARKP